MTAPLPAAPGLAAVAAWDVPLLRGAVATLTAVAGRLAAWRIRAEAVGRSLESAQCWSGPAAREAAGAVSGLSTVAVGVAGRMARSLDALERLSAEAATAHEFALTALAVGLVGPSPADEALRHAAAAEAAAVEAGAALAGVGVVDAFAPATFGELADLIGPAAVPEPPPGRRPEEVAAWWAALPALAQRATIRARPGLIGGSNGVPAWARDRANRLQLHRALADPGLPPLIARTAGAVARQLARLEEEGHPVQLHTFDLAGDRVVLALGDLDTADAVGVLVPGVFTSPGDDLGRLVGDARDVAGAARAAAPALAVATVVWLGYRTPDDPLAMAGRGTARRGGAQLAADLDGLAAARTAGGRPPARTTVLAHSYGTVVVDEAADAAGRLAADAVVLLGSPGMEDDAASLEAPEVHVAAPAGDPISWLGWFGVPPSWEGYGATALPIESTMGHSDYYDGDRPTLAALARVVAGLPATG